MSLMLSLINRNNYIYKKKQLTIFIHSSIRKLCEKKCDIVLLRRNKFSINNVRSSTIGIIEKKKSCVFYLFEATNIRSSK